MRYICQIRTPGPITLRRLVIFGITLALGVPAIAAGVCNLAATVGGGTLATSPSAGAGWNVGSGQCNGDFTVAANPLFPGGAIELGMRIEQRRVGQVNPPFHSGINYEVQRGPDPTQANRAWWNFQHSIGYNGGIASLDKLTFVIRKDVGNDIPVAPADMLALRAIIDDRPAPKTTATFSDLYQTSQNPVFGWFSPPYNLSPTAGPGAWMLTLAALKNGKIASVSVCAHTLGAACAPAPVVYSCAGFDAPMDKTVSVKKGNRVLPLKMVCSDGNGNTLGSGGIAPPVIQVTKSAPVGPATDPLGEILSAGQGTDGNEFVFDGSRWHFNLQTKNFTGSGTYTITAVAGDGGLLLLAPTATFVIE